MSNNDYLTLKISGCTVLIDVEDAQEEAALIYNSAAIKYHGEFAALNIVKGG